ncbi:hypothetical protein HU200_016067 [Digitaria exilis]|uniref:Disease resistance protein At4g27190-like leucine-rich repeats domain-containing protein n=1 Tax=Digitaria exilis TaxID=1010633 RepID=A0A835F9I1_9POAL|nr:hypothetical protein HU200_016067 [Digitaria exilis]
MVSLQPQSAPAIYAADITTDYLNQTSEDNGDASGFMSMWPCPDVPNLPNMRGYIHIQDQRTELLLWPRGEEGEENVTIVVPKFVLENGRILRMHDAISITATPLCLGTYPNGLSQLKMLQIMWCEDLEEALPYNFNYYTQGRWWPVIHEFTSLKHIHLHELPKLRRICGVKMYAPNLETVKIRGCWSLKSLPYVSSGSKVVECDCEKEWWDRLEWEDSSHANCYKPIHSRYYKKTMLRASVLR